MSIIEQALRAARVHLAEGGEITQNLIAHHNTTAKGVEAAFDLGGIPMPSMAVSNVRHPLTNFGDVSLIASPEMIKPSAHTKVYGADVYTGRQPKGEEEFRDPKAVAQAMSRDPNFGHMSDFPRMMGAHDSLESADRMMRRAQAMAALGADPKKFQRFDQFVRADHPGVDYAAPYQMADEMPGIRQYGETIRTLPPAERFTASGNRRKNIPYTMENVLKQMRGEKAWEPQQEGFDYGPASFRAGVTPALKNINEIQKQRGKIIHPDEMEAVKGEYAKTYDSMIDAMKQFAKSKDKSGFRAYEDAQEALNDIAKGKSVSWYGDIPDEMRSKVGEFVKHTKSLPTEYFEAKTKRAVPLDEFSGAIVPRGSENTINKLDKEGIKKILQYGSPEERVAMFKQFPEAMFAHGGLVLNNRKDGGEIVDYTLQKFGPATARDAVKSAKAVRGRPVKG